MYFCQFYKYNSVNIIFLITMDFGSKVCESKEYSSTVLRENYNSNNSSKFSTPSQIVDELRKKYDTPTRKDPKQSYSRQNYDKPSSTYDLEVKRSTNSTTSGEGCSIRDRWAGQGASSKNYDPSSSYSKQNIAGEQQTIFRKIKQMKDSLLNKNEKIKTTKSIYQPRMSEKVDARAPMLNDNRVENIDKINVKIQQILSCLKQTENKNGSESQFRIQTKTTTSKPLENSSKNYSYSRQSQKESKTYHYENRQNMETKVEVKNTNSIYQEDKKYKIASPAPKNVENFELSSNRGDNSKVRSFISSIQRQTGGGKYQMRSGKKLDDEISKIQSKIHQFEQEKKKLNIDFKPYSYSNSKSTIDLNKRSYTLDKNQRPLSKFQPTIIKPAESSRKTEDYSYAQRVQRAGGYEKYLEKSTQQRYSARMSFQPSTKQRKSEVSRSKDIEATQINVQISKRQVKDQTSQLFKIKLIPVDEQKSSASSRIETRLFNEDLRRKADEGIIDRKRRLTSDQPNRQRPNIKRLVEKLSEQTRLDEKLRNDKLYFESSHENNKWGVLADILSRKGVKLSQDKMQKVFKITDEENNPFFSVRESQSSIEMLANSYVESQEHWNRQIFKKFNKEDMKNQDFTMNTLDLEKKGYVVLEDIVRFLNMETGTFYRNRDLFLIFRKISQQQKISFEELINTICK